MPNASASMCSIATSTALAALLVLSAPQAAPEKESRSPAQRKINSQVLYEIYRARGEAGAKHVPPGPTGVRIDARQRALVDVRATVTSALQATVRHLGGTIVSVSERYRSIIAWVPLLRLERLAGERAVHSIEPKAEPATNAVGKNLDS
jgi:hypothetical protein